MYNTESNIGLICTLMQYGLLQMKGQCVILADSVLFVSKNWHVVHPVGE